MARWLSRLERRPVTAEVVGSIPSRVVCKSSDLHHNFIFGWVPEWPKGADCKSVAIRFDGSNPSSPTKVWLIPCFFY